MNQPPMIFRTLMDQDTDKMIDLAKAREKAGEAPYFGPAAWEYPDFNILTHEFKTDAPSIARKILLQGRIVARQQMIVHCILAGQALNRSSEIGTGTYKLLRERKSLYIAKIFSEQEGNGLIMRKEKIEDQLRLLKEMRDREEYILLYCKELVNILYVNLKKPHC